MRARGRDQAPKVIRVPVEGMTSCFGMAWWVAMIVFQPVRCIGMTWSGPIVRNASTVRATISSGAGARWKPPTIAWILPRRPRTR